MNIRLKSYKFRGKALLDIVFAEMDLPDTGTASIALSTVQVFYTSVCFIPTGGVIY